MRPTTLTGYVGQAHILGPSTVLFQLLHKSEIPNIILWGPPGCGKVFVKCIKYNSINFNIIYITFKSILNFTYINVCINSFNFRHLSQML